MNPIPGNPWPHDMVITVEHDDQQLTDLLWVRELYGLVPSGLDLPPSPLDVAAVPETAHRLRRDKRTWEAAWPSLWCTALDRYAGPGGVPARPALSAATVDALDDEEALALLRGPTWRDRFDDTPFDEAYSRWLERLSERRWPQRRTLEPIPERASLDALIRSWRRGLTTIVTIPCVGRYTRTLGSRALLVTEETRSDPARYSEALRSFAP